MREIRQGEFYRHFKGRLYQIIAVATHSETGERMVVYQALYGDYKVYVRPYDMFAGEVDHEKYPEVRQKYRFELVDVAADETHRAEQKPSSGKEEQSTAADMQSVASRAQENMVPDKKADESEEGGINPILLEFLDADTLEEKLHIMAYRQKQMDDELLNSIAISLDLVVEKKNFQEKYDEIMNCLAMMKHFECNRLH